MEKERIVIKDYSLEINQYARKVHAFNNRVAELKPKFKSFTDGIGIELNAKWVKTIIYDTLQNDIGDALLSYLETHPKFLWSTIAKSFSEQVEGLYSETTGLKSAWGALQNNYPLPSVTLSFFPFNEDGTLAINDEIIEALRQEIEIAVDNDAQSAVYDKFNSFFESLDALSGELLPGDFRLLADAIHSPFAQDKTITGIKERCQSLIEGIILNRK